MSLGARANRYAHEVAGFPLCRQGDDGSWSEGQSGKVQVSSRCSRHFEDGEVYKRESDVERNIQEEKEKRENKMLRMQPFGSRGQRPPLQSCGGGWCDGTRAAASLARCSSGSFSVPCSARSEKPVALKVFPLRVHAVLRARQPPQSRSANGDDDGYRHRRGTREEAVVVMKSAGRQIWTESRASRTCGMGEGKVN